MTQCHWPIFQSLLPETSSLRKRAASPTRPQLYRAVPRLQATAIHPRGARPRHDPVRRPALARRARHQGGVRESRLSRAGPADGDARGSARRARARRHRPVLPDQLHHRKPRQIPARARRGASGPRKSRRNTSTSPPAPAAPAASASITRATNWRCATRPRSVPHVPDRRRTGSTRARCTAAASRSTCRSRSARVGGVVHRRGAGPRISDPAL